MTASTSASRDRVPLEGGRGTQSRGSASDAVRRSPTQSMTATPRDAERVALPGGLVAVLLTAEQAGPPTPKPPEHRDESPEHARRRRRVVAAERSRRLYGGES